MFTSRNIIFVREFCEISSIKVESDFEMSDFSSPNRTRGENSNCESQSESETPKKRINEKVKNLKTKKERNSTASTVPIMSNDQSDDDTESQLQYEERPSNSINSSYTSPVSYSHQEKMRRRLQFFFMNPIEKWHAKKR